jgi:hypothetical protein
MLGNPAVNNPHNIYHVNGHVFACRWDAHQRPEVCSVKDFPRNDLIALCYEVIDFSAQVGESGTIDTEKELFYSFSTGRKSGQSSMVNHVRRKQFSEGVHITLTDELFVEAADNVLVLFDGHGSTS